MDKINDLFLAYQSQQAHVHLSTTLLNFVFCLILLFVVKAVYISYSRSLTGKQQVAHILPILGSVVFLVIVVVKSSLALSLGLVGALSIVRFRTPIKEPEELVYLFLVIGVGLGFGAGHLAITTVITLVILLTIRVWLSSRSDANRGEFNLLVSWTDKNITSEEVVQIVREEFEKVELVRYEANGNQYDAAFLVLVADVDKITTFGARLSNLNVGVMFHESNVDW